MRSSYLGTFDTQATCDSCGKRGQVAVSVFGRYAHIFWIPLCPIGKTAIAHCDNCQAKYENKTFSPELKADVKRIKSTTKAPVWQFSGLGLTAILIGYGFYADGQTTEANARYFADPKPGDKYEYRIEEDGKNTYTLFKVAAVSKDTLWAFANQYVMDKKQVGKIDLTDNYETEPTPMLRSELSRMQQRGDIIEITR